MVAAMAIDTSVNTSLLEYATFSMVLSLFYCATLTAIYRASQQRCLHLNLEAKIFKLIRFELATSTSSLVLMLLMAN